MIQKRTQLSVLVVAALAIVALVGAALLASGGAPAQATATIIAPGVEGNSMPQQQTPATPEACPGDESRPNEQAARVVDSGHIALFDVWWNPEEGELTNSSCPPTVEHVPGEDDGLGNIITPARDDRSPSSINIDETVIHIPSSAKVTLNESDYPKSNYRAVWEADDAENPNGDGDRIVWMLQACPPNGTPPAGGLCISYSAALLDPAYWDGDIEYLVGHVHQVDIDKQDPRYVLVYDVPDGEAGQPDLRWDSSDGRVDQVQVAPGGYDRPMWFFTSRGAYEFQVHIRGNPDTTRDDPRSKDESVTSDVREYILHVGAESDLGVEATVTPESSSPGDDVTIEITAGNAGPDTAPSTKVDVDLPEGLTYSSHNTATGNYDSAAGVWTINNFANGASATLSITATVDAETHGQDLTAKATISATETVTTVSGTYEVPVPDKNPNNNMAAGATTVATSANVAPMFQVTRSVPENSPAATVVGDPVAVKEPDTGDTLTFGLTGDGAGNFVASADANGNAQITVAEGAHLNYEHKRSYDLVLTVSDGKDASGNADPAVDHTIGVQVSLEDVDETVTATVQVTKHDGFITWTFTVANPPAEATNAFYRFALRDTTTGALPAAGDVRRDSLAGSLTHGDNFPYPSGTYRVEGSIQYVAGGATHYVHADIIGDSTITIP